LFIKTGVSIVLQVSDYRKIDTSTYGIVSAYENNRKSSNSTELK